jgi:hypothetical protein
LAEPTVDPASAQPLDEQPQATAGCRRDADAELALHVIEVADLFEREVEASCHHRAIEPALKVFGLQAWREVMEEAATDEVLVTSNGPLAFSSAEECYATSLIEADDAEWQRMERFRGQPLDAAGQIFVGDIDHALPYRTDRTAITITARPTRY